MKTQQSNALLSTPVHGAQHGRMCRSMILILCALLVTFASLSPALACSPPFLNIETLEWLGEGERLFLAEGEIERPANAPILFSGIRDAVVIATVNGEPAELIDQLAEDSEERPWVHPYHFTFAEPLVEGDQVELSVVYQDQEEDRVLVRYEASAPQEDYEYPEADADLKLIERREIFGGACETASHVLALRIYDEAFQDQSETQERWAFARYQIGETIYHSDLGDPLTVTGRGFWDVGLDEGSQRQVFHLALSAEAHAEAISEGVTVHLTDHRGQTLSFTLDGICARSYRDNFDFVGLGHEDEHCVNPPLMTHFPDPPFRDEEDEENEDDGDDGDDGDDDRAGAGAGAGEEGRSGDDQDEGPAEQDEDGGGAEDDDSEVMIEEGGCNQQGERPETALLFALVLLAAFPRRRIV